MNAGLGRLHRDARGAGLVEYLVIVGFIGLLALGAFRQFGTKANTKIEGQARCVSEFDPGCANAKAVNAEAPTRAEVVNAVATASAGTTQAGAGGSGVQLASAGLGAKVLDVLSWFNPIGSAQAAETPRPPTPRPTKADANADGRRIGDAVVAELRRTAPHSEMGARYSPLWPRSRIQTRDMWGESWGNQLPGALLQSPPASHWGRRSTALSQPDFCEGDACRTKAEKDFGMRECKSQADCGSGTCTGVAAAGTSLCTGHSDHLYDEVYKTIVGAQRTVTFSTFAEPSGAYTSAMRNALNELHAKQPPGGQGVDVRILIGLASDNEQEAGTSVRRILAGLTRDLPADSPVRVTVGTYGGPDRSQAHSWSHSKMIVADGKEALVGGHNWWTGDYNAQNPVHDVSIRVRGPAARQAEAYFDQLWAHTLAKGKFATSGSGTPLQRAPTETGTTGEGERVISVGVPGGTTVNVTSGVAGDTALLTMIRSARRTVKLSQQELVSQPLEEAARTNVQGFAERWYAPQWLARRLGNRAHRAMTQHIDPKLLDELALAMMRGVKVDVVLTGMDPASGTEGYSHGWTTERTRQTIETHLRTNLARLQRTQPLTAGSVDEAVANLEIRELRFSDEATIPVNGKNQPLKNHAKVLIVDDSAAYVGSQNMYPGGMAGAPPMTQLGEFGYIFVGQSVPDKMLPDYWDKMWPLAHRN